jgi:hypothetical protein
VSSRYPYPAGRVQGPHPAVVSRRLHNLLLVLAGTLIPLVLGLAITLSSPTPEPVLVFGAMIGVVCVGALLISTRYEITLTLLAVYLGMLDGPVKLEFVGRVSSALRDVLIIAVVGGMVMRLAARRQRTPLPPLSSWVIAFVLFVLVEALNPQTANVLKSIGGFRQQLEWVPFFFFGYMMIRSKKRFRQLFILLGVIAAANGVVGAIQAGESPGQLANWGPGYAGLVHGGAEGSGITGRTYSTGGEARARPPALGSDSGFGGGVGVIALPGLLALLAAGGLKRRWPVVLLSIGTLLAIATAASRTSAVVAVVVLIGFAGLSLVTGVKVGRAFIVLVFVLLLATVVGSVLIAATGKGVLARQETLTSVSRVKETGGGGKERALSVIPSELVHAPFGYGLGTAGAASGFGGKAPPQFEGERVTGGSVYNLLVKELGFPGLMLWLGLTVNVLLLGLRRVGKVPDLELRTYLVALVTGFGALTIEGFSGPTLAVTVGAFLWFVPGALGYWIGTSRSPGLQPTALVES